MKTFIVVAFCLAVLNVSLVSAEQPGAARYDNFKLYKVFVKDDSQLDAFKQLATKLPIRQLNAVGGPGRNYDIVIDPDNQAKLEAQLKASDLGFERTVEDLHQLLEESETLPRKLNVDLNINLNLDLFQSGMNWTSYQSLDTINKWLDSLVLKNLLQVTPYVIGRSFEGRPIKAVRISARLGNKAIFMESNIHAIEWISSAATSCIIQNLLNAQSAEMRRLLWNYDWIFVPIVNPDGFWYSHNVERLWRKNRKPTGFSNSSGVCYGVDLNRNFHYMWGGAGYNIDVPCDHWYGGAEADSEPEVQALERFVNSFPNNYIRMYLAFHSYGNMVLLPYGHTNEELPPNYDQMERISKAFKTAAAVRYGTVFEYGASGKLNYPVSGASKDWAYGVKNIPYSATIELRDDGKRYGFFLPASQILEVCAEVTDGLIAMIQQATNEGLFG